MAKVHQVNYRLPLTVVRITGTDTVTIDAFADKALHARTGDAALVTIGDPDDARVARLRSSAFNDLAATLTLTDDQRLVSAKSESTGTLGGVVTQALGVAATIVGVALPARGTGLQADRDTTPESVYASKHPKESKGRTAYRERLARLALSIDATIGELTDLMTESGPEDATSNTTAMQAAAPQPEPSNPAARRAELAARLRTLHRLRTEAETELARLDAHFAAWRAETRTTHTVARSFDIRADALPWRDQIITMTPAIQPTWTDEDHGEAGSADENVMGAALGTTTHQAGPTEQERSTEARDRAPGSLAAQEATTQPAAPTEQPRPTEARDHAPDLFGYLDEDKLGKNVLEAWEALGVLVVLVGQPPAAKVDERQRDEDQGDGVWLRIPRTVHWQLWRQIPTLRAPATEPPRAHVELVREGRSVVVDATCRRRFVHFRRSWWARRSTSVEFSDAGALRTFALTSTSAAAAAAAAASQVPGVVSTGLTAASTIRTTLQTLEDSDEQRRLAELQRQIDMREKELKLAGLQATAAQHAELARLKQQSELIAARGAVSPTAVETATVVREIALLDALRGESRASRELQAETELAQLRLEVERLKAQWLVEHPEK